MPGVDGGKVVYASADPTTSYTFSDAIDMGDHPFVGITIVTGGLVPTSFEVKRQLSHDGTTWEDETGDDYAAGIGLRRVRVDAVQDAAGTPANGRYAWAYERFGHRYMRLAVKRTGGDATTRFAATRAFGTIG